MAQFYQEGPHSYENWNGQIYKNGVLVPRENYQYIPSQVGGSRVDPNPLAAISGSTTPIPGAPPTGTGNIGGNPNVVPGLANMSNTGGAPAGTVGVRNYLTGQGYDNTKIGWNQGTDTTPSQVTYGGTPFLTPQTNMGGTTYDTVDNIMSGLKTAGLLPNNAPKAAAPAAAPASATPAMTLPVAPPPVSAEEQAYGKQIADMLAQISQRITNPATYNPATDPAYDVLSKQVAKDVREQMIQRGILKSTITGDETTKGIASLIPALQESFYNREQGQIGNLNNLTGLLSGQQNQLYNQRTGGSQQVLQNLMALAGLTGNIGGQQTIQAQGQKFDQGIAQAGVHAEDLRGQFRQAFHQGGAAG